MHLSTNDPESVRVFRFIRGHGLKWGGLIAAFVAIVWFGFGGTFLQPRNEGTKPVDAEIRAISGTLYQYFEEYQEYPSGGSKDITAALLGRLPDRRRFLDWDESRINAEGELLDTWRNPYRIRIAGVQVDVRSAGPDLLYETKDDIAIKW